MSGDVQPRKRKDKRKKKEGGSLGMTHEPISSHKFRSEAEDRKVFDLPEQGEKIHVQNEHGIGGNIWVKIIFFCLFGLLVGAVSLIYLKSQGSSDVDLPTLEESRFADYFTGWLDDNINEHEHETVKNEMYQDHNHIDNDELDDHEDTDAEEENDEEDQSVEQDPIHKLFGVENVDSEEVHKSNMNVNEAIENDGSEEKEVYEDEEDEDEDEDEVEVEGEDDESDEINKEAKDGDGDGESEEIEQEEKDEDGINENYDSDDMDDQDDDRDNNEEINDEEINEGIKYDASLVAGYESYKVDENKKSKDINKRRPYGVKKRLGSRTDDGENDDNDDSCDKKEESNEDGSEEEEQQAENLEENDDLSFEEIDISEGDLDDFEIESVEDVKDDSKEKTEKSFKEENAEKEPKGVASEIMNEDEEIAVETGGVAIKLGVGIALIIIAHLVLVQKWKSVSNAASDEKSAFETETAKEKNEMENLHSSVEPIISRRQTLLPENVFFNDEEDMGDEDEEEMEDEDEEEEEEEEDSEVNDEICLKEKFGEKEFQKLKNNNWNNFEEPLWKIKSQENKSEVKTDLIANEELEDDEEENEEEEEDEGAEEEGQEEEEEEEELEDEEEMEDEEDDYEEDDQIQDNNDFRKQKVVNQIIEELSSQEELTESTPIPPPRAHRDGRGPQDVDEDPIKHFEDICETEEGPDGCTKGGEITSNQHSGSENQKTSVEKEQADEWSYRRELEFGDDQFENNPKAAVEAYERVISKKPTLLRALIGRARALDHWAEKEKSNAHLRQAIDAYKSLLLNNGNLLDDETYVKLAERCIERMRFAGALISAIEVHKALIMKYPNTPKYRNMLAVTYLMMNKIPQARVLLKETLSLWPGNGFALVHYGFILKTSDDNMEEGAEKLMAGIQTREEGVINGMFFFHLGDALHRLGRGKEAMEWYELGVKEGLFLSKYQRSLYNVNRLKGQPWWTKEDTTYQDFFKKLENNWREIRREGLELLNSKGVNLFKEEAENLKDTGDWKQLDLYFRGKKTPGCKKAPITCSLVSSFQPAATCTRGQIKFSVMLPKTHVWPHCGPTNCRLRSHLGLVVPKHTFIRVAEETRSWEEGKFIIFDDSFEHEVWHNGTGPRLVLIVDVWHPELTNHERRQLSPI